MDVTVSNSVLLTNNTVEVGELGDMLPAIRIEFRINLLLLGIFCSAVSFVIICIFVYCCYRADNFQSSYDCSWSYDSTATQSVLQQESGFSTELIPGPMAGQCPPTSNKEQVFSFKNETIFEQSEGEESSLVLRSYENCRREGIF